MQRLICALVCALSLLSSSLKAAPLTLEDASNELSADASQCAAFYAISIHCFSDRLDEANRKDFEAGQQMASTITYMGGKKAGMSDKAVMARVELAMQQLEDDINKSCVNISVILNKYAKSCQSLIRNPEGRLRQLQAGGR